MRLRRPSFKRVIEQIGRIRNWRAAVYRQYARQHASLGLGGTFRPAFETLKELIGKHVKGRNALDFGCGGGRSARFLDTLGFTTTGVDISRRQISEARRIDPSGEYRKLGLLRRRRLPGKNYDLVLANAVFPEMHSTRKIVAALNSMKRVLSQNGKIIVVTATPEAYCHKWASYEGTIENTGKTSGSRVKLKVVGTGIIFHDYLWFPSDYLKAFEKAGLKVAEGVKPLGRPQDNEGYITETEKPFWQIYVLEPKK